MVNIREPKELLAQKLASSPKTLFSPSDIEDMFEELRTDSGTGRERHAREIPKVGFQKQGAPRGERLGIDVLIA